MTRRRSSCCLLRLNVKTPASSPPFRDRQGQHSLCTDILLSGIATRAQKAEETTSTVRAAPETAKSQKPIELIGSLGQRSPAASVSAIRSASAPEICHRDWV